MRCAVIVYKGHQRCKVSWWYNEKMATAVIKKNTLLHICLWCWCWNICHVCVLWLYLVFCKDQRLHWKGQELTWFEHLGWWQMWWQVSWLSAVFFSINENKI